MKRPPIFVKGDLDGFFGLFIDNLVQLILIISLLGLCGIEKDSPLLLEAILPGIAMSLLIGNLFYAWQAWSLARKTGRDDVTALPYGINTPSVIIFIFFVIKPVYDSTQNAELAWKMGLLACLGSGVIEFLGSFVGSKIRKTTPRAALLSTLAGIAIGFIAMTFALQIYQRPLVAMLPLGIILLSYFAHYQFPWGLPGGLLAVLTGTAFAWIFPNILPVTIAGPPMDPAAISASISSVKFYAPQFAGKEIWEVLQETQGWIGFLSVIIPMGLFNVLGSMQNVESAEAAGDSYSTGTSMAVNGIGSIVAACFGSCFPTTIYIGHPGWKALGARSGYSSLNGIVITLICLTGLASLIQSIIPLEAGIAIVLWIGIIITAQAFQATPSDQAPAVAMGLFPAIAAWGATAVMGAFTLLGFSGESVPSMQQLLENNPGVEINGFLLNGLLVMERGYIFTCMILSAMAACLIQRKYGAAAIWSAIAALLTFVGLIHTYQLSGNVIDSLLIHQSPAEGMYLNRGYGIAIGYLLLAALFVMIWHFNKRSSSD
ncbi:MAG: NCS2 family permease [Planctomycetaceae bacterium]